MITFREFLPELWASKIFDYSRQKNGSVYGVGYFWKQMIDAKKWISISNPKKSHLRLHKKNECSYCNEKITAEGGDGDHVVGRDMDDIHWLVPCCKQCNSSKGKKDLIEWWVDFKGKNILDLDKDVLSVYVRGKYRLFDREGKLDEECPEYFELALQQIKNNWVVVV